ncbi:MAG: hypothetical protein ACRDQW_08420 [Haloechinothrix sp.]
MSSCIDPARHPYGGGDLLTAVAGQVIRWELVTAVLASSLGGLATDFDAERRRRRARVRLVTNPSSRWLPLLAELDRSRRYGRGFALIRIDAVIALPRAGLADRRRRRRDGSLPERLRTRLRHSDHLWEERGRVYVLLPEADRAGATHALQRVRRVDPELLTATATQVAVFPDDGVTSGALLTSLQHRTGIRSSTRHQPGLLQGAES